MRGVRTGRVPAETRGPRGQSMLPAATRVDKATFEDLKSEDRGAQNTR